MKSYFSDVRWVTRLVTLLALCLLLFGLSATMFAQGGPRGAITGTVKDPSGAVIPDATVQIINQGTGVAERTVASGKDGSFTATLLPVAIYRLMVTAPKEAHFATLEAPGVEVRVTETTTVALVMKPGAATEVVEVSGVAAAVNTANATTGETIGAHTASTLPLVTRNFFALLALSSGANTEIFDSAALGRGAVSINVNGMRPTNNNYVLEGIPANDFNLPILDNVPLPNPDTIQEFKTQTSMYDASSGRNGGGNVQVALKSGSKDWHGDAYDFYRNDKMNANDWFLKASQLTEPTPFNQNPRLHQQQFGGSLGGPIPITKDWFIFGNYQGTRETSGASSGTQINQPITALPTTRNAATLTSTFFPGGFTAWGLPASTTLNSVALNILNLPASACPTFAAGAYCIPSVGTPGLVGAPNTTTAPTPNQGNVTRSSPGTYNEDEFTISSDKSIGDKDKLSYRWFYANFDTDQPFGGGARLPFARSIPQQNRFAKLGWTHIFSKDMVNDARFGFNRFVFLRSPFEPISASEIGETRPNLTDFAAMSDYAVTGQLGLGTGANDDRGTFSNGFTYADDLSITKGKHVLRLGGEVDQYELNRYNNFATRGTVNFNSQSGCDGTTDDLNSVQNFLLGCVGTTQAESGITRYYFRAMDFATYFQDDWKIKPRLTLNLGLRWEFLSTAHDKRGYGTNFNFDATTNPPIQEIHPGSFQGPLATSGVPDCTLNNCLFKKALEPRAGFAWDIFGNQKTVVRGGFGIFYQRISNQALLQTTGGLPFQIAVAAPGPFTVSAANPFPNLLPAGLFPLSYGDTFPTLAAFNPTTGAPIFNSASGGPAAAAYFQPVRSFVPPHSMTWNFSVERQLAKDWVLQLAYVGSKGYNLVGPGGALDYSQYCTELKPCVIPNTIGQNVSVLPGTPFVTKNADGSITITGSTGANAEARVPAQYLGNSNNLFFQTYNGSYSDYHSAQISVTHRFGNGLYFQGAYTYSKSIDNSSGSSFSDELNGLFLWGDDSNPNEGRGVSDFDRPHRFSASWNYEVPLGRWLGKGNQGLGKVVNGWSVNGLFVWQSGLPFMVYNSGATTLSDPFNENDSFFATYAPGASRSSAFMGHCTVNGITYAAGSIGCFINPAALSGANCVNAQNVMVSCSDPTALAGFVLNGNVGRNIFRSPRQSNIDFSLIKNTRITEKTNLELRVEAFNLINHPAFNGPQAGPTSPINGATGGSFGNYGVVDISTLNTAIISTANRPRIMQLAARFSF